MAASWTCFTCIGFLVKEDYGSLLAFLDQQQNKALLFLFHEKKD